MSDEILFYLHNFKNSYPVTGHTKTPPNNSKAENLNQVSPFLGEKTWACYYLSENLKFKFYDHEGIWGDEIRAWGKWPRIKLIPRAANASLPF